MAANAQLTTVKHRAAQTNVLNLLDETETTVLAGALTAVLSLDSELVGARFIAGILLLSDSTFAGCHSHFGTMRHELPLLHSLGQIFDEFASACSC